MGGVKGGGDNNFGARARARARERARERNSRMRMENEDGELCRMKAIVFSKELSSLFTRWLMLLSLSLMLSSMLFLSLSFFLNIIKD